MATVTAPRLTHAGAVGDPLREDLKLLIRISGVVKFRSSGHCKCSCSCYRCAGTMKALSSGFFKATFGKGNYQGVKRLSQAQQQESIKIIDSQLVCPGRKTSGRLGGLCTLVIHFYHQIYQATAWGFLHGTVLLISNVALFADASGIDQAVPVVLVSLSPHPNARHRMRLNELSP